MDGGLTKSSADFKRRRYKKGRVRLTSKECGMTKVVFGTLKRTEPLKHKSIDYGFVLEVTEGISVQLTELNATQATLCRT